MTISPLWMQNLPYSARLDRQVLAELYDEGVLDLTAYRVTETGGGASMAVDVSEGKAVVEGDDQPRQGRYLVESTATETPTVSAAPGSNSRYDLVVLQVRDPNAGGPAGDDAEVVVIAGTPAASPSVPATPDSALPLAVLGPIPAGTVGITDAMIEDVRPIAGRRTHVGAMEAYTGPTTRIPTGWVWADGVDKLRADYPRLHALYEAMGYPYGAGDGVTTFGIPDGRGRMVLASSGSFAVGVEGGAATVTLTTGQLPSHSHTVSSHTHSIGSHSHTVNSHTHSGPSHSHAAGTLTAATNGEHRHTYSAAQYPNIYYTPGTGSGFNPATTNASVNTGYAGDHSHDVTGSTAAAGTGNTGASAPGTNSAGSGNTGSAAPGTTSVGSGNPVTVMNPHVVVGAWIIRT